MDDSLQSLNHDAFWHIAKHLTDARDVLHLALTSKGMWANLSNELYQVEVINMEKEEKEIGAHYYTTPAIHIAIREGRVRVVDSLIKAAMKHWPGYLDVKGNPGLTPVHFAASKGNTAIVQKLHNAGCDINADVLLATGKCQIFNHRHNLRDLSGLGDHRLGHTPYGEEKVDSLSLAIMFKQPNTVQYLLDKMDLRRPHSPSRDRISPLHAAALVGDVNLVEHFLSLGFPQETFRQISGATFQETALHYAAAGRYDNTQVLRMLLDRGANLRSVAMGSQTALEAAFTNAQWPVNFEFLLHHSIQNNNIHAVDWQRTLKRAVRCNGLLPVIKTIIEETDIISERMQKRVLLDLIKGSPIPSNDSFMFLIGMLFPPGQNHQGYLLPWEGCNINAPYYPTWIAETILQAILAAPKFELRCFQAVLQYRDCDLEASDVKGRTAMQYAVYHHHYDAGLMLLERGSEWKLLTINEKLAMSNWLRKQRNPENRPRYWAARLKKDVEDSRRKLRKEGVERRL
ncbi:hypothetical protein PG987_009014 [Apiospora arundinis]